MRAFPYYVHQPRKTAEYKTPLVPVQPTDVDVDGVVGRYWDELVYGKTESGSEAKRSGGNDTKAGRKSNL